MSRRWWSVLALPLLLLPGCLYAHVKGPLDTDLDQTKLGNKVGKAHTTSILWAVAWGDAGIQAAAANGGITTINHADTETLQVLYGLYWKQTVIVYGD